MYFTKYNCQYHVCKHLHENLWPPTWLKLKRRWTINVIKDLKGESTPEVVQYSQTLLTGVSLPQGILCICSFLWSFLMSCDRSSFTAPCSSLFMHTSSCLSGWSSQYSRLSSFTSWSLTPAIYIDFSLLDCPELKAACSESKLFTWVKGCRIRKDKDESQLADSH